jgi:outer membrane receptor for monomeric catechols
MVCGRGCAWKFVWQAVGGVWQAVGGMGLFLHYHSSKKAWTVSSRESMEAGNGKSVMRVKSTAATPDQITEQWKVHDGTDCWVNAPNLRARVCSSVEKHAAEQRVEQEQVQALKQAHESCRLVVEGLANDQNQVMGAYELMERKVVSGRAVWQKQGGDEETFLYYSSHSNWCFSDREDMETGRPTSFMKLVSAALTPDQTRSSEVWQVDDGTQWVANPEVQVRRQQQ